MKECCLTIRIALNKSFPRPSRLAIRIAFAATLVLNASFMSGCGYTLQSTKTNSLHEIGIERVYVAPVKNLSYKPGVENLFYNELTQALLAGKRVRLVDRPEYADAILSASVGTASYVPSATTSSDSIFPTSISTIQITVATEYQADVSCSFVLNRLKNGTKTGEPIWESTFTRSRRFSASNQKAEYGTTSGLINESEFERSLRLVAHGMMQDVHESMIARF